MRKNFTQRIAAVFVAMLCCLTSFAYDFTVDGIYYDYVNGSSGSEVSVTCGTTDYSGAVTIPESVTYIGKIYKVTSISRIAFEDCTGLTSVEIPNSVTSIGVYAFYNCTGLTSVNIPNSVTSIGNCAFQNCTGLTSVNIPNSVTSIGTWAFYNCTGLTSIKVDSSNQNYKDDNGRALLAKEGNPLICYANNSGSSYSIPYSVTSIGSFAFYNCTGLTSVNIPNSVTSIGHSAFSDCTGLTSVKIPKSVTEIEGCAFWGCTGLTSVTSLNPTPPTCYSWLGVTFSDYSIPLYVPIGLKAAYEAADEWMKFTNIIEKELSSIDDVIAPTTPAIVDVYSLQGVLLRKQVLSSEASEGLHPGIYIIGGKKVMVK